MQEIVVEILWSAAVFLITACVLVFLNRRLLTYFADKPHQAFRRQLLQLGGVMAALLVVLLLLPLADSTRGQLISLYGIIVSATIALSSTSLVGNIMAGIMLRMVNNIKAGDYVRVGEYFGRISEMDLLHTEIQTEERDLTTLPNLYLVQNPVRVMRTSGTILSVEVGLGYDISRTQIEDLLLQAATETGLRKPFVQIIDLGDFAITYKVSGLLVEVNQLIDKRRELRAHTVDFLHRAHIEIASPTLMNTRSYSAESTIIPEKTYFTPDVEQSQSPDSLVFDKAEQAESVSRLKEKLSDLVARHKDCLEIAEQASDQKHIDAANRECDSLQVRIERMQSAIELRETQISNE